MYENILDAYKIICLEYTSSKDEIHLVGFSRGAFTARCVAQMINEIGLLTQNGLKRLSELFHLWNEGHHDQLKPLVDKAFNAHESLPDVRIKTCTVWDTVSSFGLPDSRFFFGSPKRKLKFVNSELCGNIEHAFQALSLSERRWNYQPIVWKAPPSDSNQSLKQCWFLGFHSDVGGGSQRGMPLAYFSLFWAIDQLKGYLKLDVQSLMDVSTNSPFLICPTIYTTLPAGWEGRGIRQFGS